MKTKHVIILSLLLGGFVGYMIGMSMDPLDLAIRKAQKINKGNLAGISSFRKGGGFNLLGFFTKNKSLQEQINTDTQFSNQYVTRISNNIDNKEKAIKTLDETKEFVKLATKEVFIENSLQRYLVSLGRVQLENGMVFQAITNLERAYSITPGDSSSSQLLSSAYLALYQVLPEGSEKSSVGEKAVRFLKLTLSSKPNSINTMYGLALIYTDQGIYSEALSLFLQILDRDPENIEALLGVARIYYDQGDIDKSRRIYEQTEALILGLKNRRRFLRSGINNNVLDQKLSVIRNNLTIIYDTKNIIGK